MPVPTEDPPHTRPTPNHLPAFLPVGREASIASPTKAKPEIWTEQAKFKDAGDKAMAETAKLAAAAKTGNLDALKTAFAATAGTCKACHDAYRSQ